MRIPAKASRTRVVNRPGAVQRALVAAYSFLVIVPACVIGSTRAAAMTIDAFKLKYGFMKTPC
jgi:hypothetical protein